MAVLHRDFLKGTLSSGVNASAQTLTSAAFAGLPVVAAPDVMWVTLDPAASAGAPEVVRVTAHTSGATSVTVDRGQLGTTARSHALDVPWVHALHAAEVDQLRADIDAKLPLAGGTLTGDLVVSPGRALSLGKTPTGTMEAATKGFVDGWRAGQVASVSQWRSPANLGLATTIQVPPVPVSYTFNTPTMLSAGTYLFRAMSTLVTDISSQPVLRVTAQMSGASQLSVSGPTPDLRLTFGYSAYHNLGTFTVPSAGSYAPRLNFLGISGVGAPTVYEILVTVEQVQLQAVT